jgi:hypothetical protein
MTESDYTQLLLRALRQRLPRAVTFKLSDRYTAGVPDLTTTYKRCTNWYEAKKIDSRHVHEGCALVKPSRDVPELQWETLRRLGRGHLIVYTDEGHAITHVTGVRSSVTLMKLRLISMIELANRITTIAEQGEKYESD